MFYCDALDHAIRYRLIGFSLLPMLRISFICIYLSIFPQHILLLLSFSHRSNIHIMYPNLVKRHCGDTDIDKKQTNNKNGIGSERGKKG